jgi:hypothetical protein
MTNLCVSISRVIQLSHPVTNTLMLIGFCLCFTSIFFIGLDGQFVPESVFPIMCTFRKWILSLGFSLAYGAMFSKVWRVHRLTTKHKSEAKVQATQRMKLMNQSQTHVNLFCPSTPSSTKFSPGSYTF